MAPRIIILITTHNRADMLLDLLKDTKEQFIDNYKIKVYNDSSTDDYTGVARYIKTFNEYYYERTTAHHGKYYFWLLHQKMYSELRDEKFDYFIQLPDDVRLIKNFNHEAINHFIGSGAEVLNILNSDGLRIKMKEQQIKTTRINGYMYWHKHWMDGCFVSDRRFFEIMNFTCPPVNGSWFVNRGPWASSGVGTAITRNFPGTIKVADKPLVVHGNHKSVMNPDKVYT